MTRLTAKSSGFICPVLDSLQSLMVNGFAPPVLSKLSKLSKFINVTKHLANQLLYRNSLKSNEIKSNQIKCWFLVRGKPEYPGENLS